MNSFKKTIITFCAITIALILPSCKTNIEQTTKPTTATITYISNEGKRFENERIVPIGYKIQDIDILELSCEGYIFKGWLYGNELIKIGTKITKDITLTAQWEEIKDTMAPSNVRDVNIVDNNFEKIISWKNPLDRDFNGIELSLFGNGKLLKTEKLNYTTTNYTIKLENNSVQYILKIRTYDTSNNYSEYINYTLNKPLFTEDGLSLVTVSLGELPSYRTYFPDPYTKEILSKYLYVLTGCKSSSDSSSIIPTVNMTDKTTIFTYEEIALGLAKKALDPIKWNLTLTAYQKKNNEADFTKPVLIGNIQNIDLSMGEMNVSFYMEAYTPHLGPGIDDQARGLFNYKISFHDNLKNNTIDGFIVDIIDSTTSKSVLNNSINITRNQFKLIDQKSKYTTIESSQPIEVRGGTYYLKVEALPSRLGCHYLSTIIINNGNTTNFNWPIPDHLFNDN